MKKEDKKWRVSNCKKSYMVAHNTLVDLHNILIDEIFDEHEAQLKGLKQIIQNQSDLLEMYSKDNEVPNNAYLVKQLKAKDEEMERLKEDLNYLLKELGSKYNEDAMLKDNQ